MTDRDAGQTDDGDDDTDGEKLGMGIAVGISIGVAVGTATDNLALWLPMGVASGRGGASASNYVPSAVRIVTARASSVPPPRSSATTYRTSTIGDSSLWGSISS